MKAAVVPAVNARWEVREIPVPEPGPTQVLIRIRASGLCYTDVHIASGALGVKFPHVLGHEPVGEIVAVGSAVTTRKKGDRVGVPWVQAGCGRCEWCLRGKPMFCASSVGTGIQTQGSHAEYMLAEAAATMLVPEGLAWEQAAPVFCDPNAARSATREASLSASRRSESAARRRRRRSAARAERSRRRDHSEMQCAPNARAGGALSARAGVRAARG